LAIPNADSGTSASPGIGHTFTETHRKQVGLAERAENPSMANTALEYVGLARPARGGARGV
jgi:hypothetical protein